MKVKWIYRTGTNKKFGYVEKDKYYTRFSHDEISFGLHYGLLEKVEEDKKTKKSIKIKED